MAQNGRGFRNGGYAQNREHKKAEGEIEMNKLFVRLVGLGGLLMSCGLLAGCMEIPVGEQRPYPVAAVTALPPYPGLIPVTPLPQPSYTPANGTPFPWAGGLSSTPSPDEQLALGAITLLEMPPVPTRYSIRNEYVGEGINKRFILFLLDTQTGNEVRLGNDGDAVFQVKSDNYVIWSYRCDVCDQLKSGLYAHSLDTGQEIFITDRFGNLGRPKIDGQWVIYTNRPDPKVYIVELYAHNLTTGEDFRVVERVRFAYATMNQNYAVRGDKIVWFMPGTQQGGEIGVYDLETRQARILSVPQMEVPYYLDVFDDLVIWRNYFWQGYDVARDAYFTIPVIPPGWENVSIHTTSQVTARDHQLYWSLEVNVNGQEYYFTAPVLPREEAPQTVQPIPTPIGLPAIAPPVDTPTIRPTAYP
jgi:hypothetical protein